jgi:hypothetical protein
MAGPLEVTQSIQNLRNDVPLVKDRPTFVRFHCTSTMNRQPTRAILRLERAGGITTDLSPALANPVAVRVDPERRRVDHAFLFELPDTWRRNAVTLTGILNPVTSWRDRDPVEYDYSNNTTTTSIGFNRVPTVNLIIYRVRYEESGTQYVAAQFHADYMVDWLYAAYPVRRVRVRHRTCWQRGQGFTAGNVILTMHRLYKLDNSAYYNKTGEKLQNIRYYGMVDDRGVYMRGVAAGIPSFKAAGPTGVARFGWDTDGSYGDWYGCHELGHTFSRYHAEYCGASGGRSYPYPKGNISKYLIGDQALCGYDRRIPTIYMPSCFDLMSYCDNLWVSDFTYWGIYLYLWAYFAPGDAGVLPGVAEGDIPKAAAPAAKAGQILLVNGLIRPQEGTSEFRPFLTVADSGLPDERVPGDYEIRLLDRRGGTLARYPFTPSVASVDHHGAPGPAPELLLAQEHVPYVEGTRHVQIRGPAGLVHGVNPGARPPAVRITKPAGGELLDEDPVIVAWEGGDLDGDEVRYCVQYAPVGQAWVTVAADVEDTHVAIDRLNLAAADAALFRILATDGLNTTEAVSEKPFKVPNRPPTVRVVRPLGRTVIATDQTLTLEAKAYDVDEGTLHEGHLTWTSNRDGEIGRGNLIVVTGLSVGLHRVTVTARDRANATVEDDVEVQVVGNITQVPLTPEADLVLSKDRCRLDIGAGATNDIIEVRNVDPNLQISWNAAAGNPTLTLSERSGMTPANVVVSVGSVAGLPPGTHNTAVTFTSGEVPYIRRVSVAVVIPGPEPDVRFIRADANGDGRVDIGDAITTLGYLFLGNQPIACRDALDSNDDGGIQISDAINTLSVLFAGQGTIPVPGMTDCGLDPTPDDLPCESFEACSDP